MPIIKSAKKRVKIAAKANARNAKTRRRLRETFKAFKLALNAGKAEAIAKTQRDAVSAIDIAAKKNVIHRNKAARKKSQLAAMAKAMIRPGSPSSKGVKPAKSVKPKAKSSTKKTAAKTQK